MQKIEYALCEDGIKLRTIDESPVELLPSFFAEMGRHATLERRSVLQLPNCGPVHARYHHDVDYYTINLNRIVLRCGWTVRDNGLVTPDFRRESHPQMELTWKVPEDMKLVMLIALNHASCYEVGYQWLLAYRMNRRDAHKLPLANVHEDGRLCDDASGENSYTGDIPQQALEKALTQFDNSRYNSDLWGNEVRQYTGYIFRWEAAGTQYKQLAVANAHWWDMCPIVAPDVVGEVLL